MLRRTHKTTVQIYKYEAAHGDAGIIVRQCGEEIN
jgi:hypothetical protein